MSPVISNLFLSGLSRDSHESLVSRCSRVALPPQTLLYDSGPWPAHAYFLTSGLASVVTLMPNGDSAEVAFIGCEGLVGSLQLLGQNATTMRCSMQMAGTGLRIRFTALQQLFTASEEIRNRILAFVQAQTTMVGQVAGCNRLHSAEQRLTRWLLMARDQTSSSHLTFTQQYLSEMIGTQRTTVTVLAGDLQQRGLISYSRGSIQILDGPRLEQIACDCYPVMKRLHANLYGAETFPVATNHQPFLPAASQPVA